MAIAGQGITIIGGGIGGLTLALALHAKGAEVRVLEQADAIREVGAGIQVSPNGFAVLNALGLGDAFGKISVTGQAVSLRDYKAGREVTRLDLTGLPDPQSYRFVHRADLIELLATSVRESGVTLRLLQKAETVVAGARPRVELANGDHVEDDLIIGADGLHSVLRPVLNGVAAPFFTGQVAWRTVVPNLMGHPPEARVHMGPGRHVVSYPLRGGEAVNLVAVEERRDWQAEGWSHTGDPAQLRAAFADFGGMVPEMLHAADQPGVWGLFRHNVARHWFGENVALLGDAAHPTLPFMAQGAVMAMEDAWVLADRLDRAEDVAQGLADYQNTRRDRVVKVVEAANGNAWKYHLSNPLVRSAAHLGLGMMGRLAPGKMLSQFDWIYKHDVTAAR
ncbi:3-hydroxybenzoate 6-hydroxylase 1 [Pelagimonas phthalicica]|uniref:3-hydroxybenzoate 6-hydroxylase 1 n=1 Tax=Pelagimonas phthalicica TaxID=1037362 RepID=A0A238JD18_9RHOB|nr:FAD-dependent monooxygenase [Pelagimonas phthalicica]TDS91460.1 salicylate hydroxylase [Pelagimonas phthalicica]SMX28509.1 3-hydroxybenzoate 6-hydroxylase 1 [Pelagimonas phthalicica]